MVSNATFNNISAIVYHDG